MIQLKRVDPLFGGDADARYKELRRLIACQVLWVSFSLCGSNALHLGKATMAAAASRSILFQRPG